MTINGTILREESSQLYLGVTLRAEGLRDTKSVQRAMEGGKNISTLIGQRWWSLQMPTKHLAPIFDTVVRSKYKYDLILTGGV